MDGIYIRRPRPASADFRLHVERHPTLQPESDPDFALQENLTRFQEPERQGSDRENISLLDAEIPLLFRPEVDTILVEIVRGTVEAAIVFLPEFGLESHCALSGRFRPEQGRRFEKHPRAAHFMYIRGVQAAPKQRGRE